MISMSLQGTDASIAVLVYNSGEESGLRDAQTDSDTNKLRVANTKVK